MPILNFKERFVAPIRSGRKRHTIRANRKVPVKRGDKLYLYCGLRHKGAYRILPEPQDCTMVQEIYICEGADTPHLISVDSVDLGPDERERLAYCDGLVVGS